MGEQICSVRDERGVQTLARTSGATFEPAKGGHLWVMLRGRRSILPMHGSRKEMKKGTVAAIKSSWAGVRTKCGPYPANLMPDPDGGFTVTFRDVPEAITEATAARKRCCGPRTHWNCLGDVCRRKRTAARSITLLSLTK